MHCQGVCSEDGDAEEILMNIHDLKIQHCYYADVDSGIKTFELRYDDRKYSVNDLIRFTEVFPGGKLQTHNELYKIMYILRNVPEYGLKPGYCILAIKKIRIRRPIKRLTKRKEQKSK